MHVFVTREYQHGEETGEARAYTSLEAAKRYLESRLPARDRVTWRQRYPSQWLGRIRGAAKELSLYIDRLDVLE